MRSKSKRKHDHKNNPARKRQSTPAEGRRAEAVTVAWIISSIATACAVGVSVVAYVMARPDAAAASSPDIWQLVLPLMLFTGSVTGLIAFCLTPLVYLVRRVPPPWIVTVLAVAISVSPLVALLTFGAR